MTERFERHVDALHRNLVKVIRTGSVFGVGTANLKQANAEKRLRRGVSLYTFQLSSSPIDTRSSNRFKA
jgi:hypothetical protein